MAETGKPPADRSVEWVPLGAVVSADDNPREHDIPALRRSIGRFGFADPPEMDDRTGKLVAGHGRVAALTAMLDDGESPPAGVRLGDDGGWLVPVLRGWSSRTDAEALAYLVSNNRQTERARWDDEGLYEVLSEIAEADRDLLQDAGYVDDDLDDMRRLLNDDTVDTRERPEAGDNDGYTTVKVKAPHHVSAAWQAYLDSRDGDGSRALGELLGVR